MLHTLSTVFVSTLFILATTTVNAHDPALHKKENAEKPNCAGMEGMDHSKMDMSDPIMQAMMAQCMEGDHGNEHTTDEKDANEPKDTGHHKGMKKSH